MLAKEYFEFTFTELEWTRLTRLVEEAACITDRLLYESGQT